MKEDHNNHQEAQAARWDYRFNQLICIVVFVFSGLIQSLNAQCLPHTTLFKSGEYIKYDIYYKWGLLTPKAGEAELNINQATYENSPAWHYRIRINTAGIAETFYKVRDTIDNYYSLGKPLLLYSSKRTNEGGYYQIENITFSYKEKNASAHVFRRSASSVKIDTMMYAQECLYDILGTTVHLRGLDVENLQQGQEFPLQVAMGRSLINVSYRYEGQQIVERGNVKYSTRLFYVDIYDEAFTTSKESAEIWLGNDDNQIPVKIRAKLRIGAMEAYYNTSSGLRYPLDSRIVLKK
ncbi:DUF3108 domain-containing protein [Parabacteroides sp. PF5-9]|uniref:DUF3108 domain-containing protein n=1 Tax=Parabacteroides sp. PF5-9 TaxID=1742404 RepID=UPI0024742C16|nr:DUF3108 domain-containing protein [Parabacteroides sp. PF5-9]MDH6357681.1 hypothetical protein [Parabacteroides sp. PF5-9]